MPRQTKEYIGVTRQLDNVSRIVLPVEFRKELDISSGDEVEIKLVLINKTKKVLEISKKEK